MDWPKQRLGDLCNVQLGKTPPRGQSRYWDKDRVTDNVWLSIADLVHGEAVSDSKEYITDQAADIVNITPAETLLLSFKLTIGRVSFAGRDLYTNEAIASLLNLSPKLDKRFLYYYFSGFDWDTLTEGDIKLKGKTLNKAKLNELPVPAPPLPEQQRIVTKLDAAFGALREAEGHVERNRANARELFESYLNGVFEGKGNGWVEKRLDEICDVRDGTHASPKYHMTGYALVTSKNLKPDGLELENVSLINEDDFNEINRRSKVDKGDVLFAMIGTIGNPTVIEDEPNFAIKNVALFKCGSVLDGRFLRYALLTSDVKERMRKEAKGTTQRFVGLGYLRSFRIAVPALSDQRRIVTELDELNERARELEATYQQKLRELEGLKKGLLGAAFRGEL